MKIPWQLVLAAFCGGICLPISELMKMLSNKEVADVFFFGGMALAGVIGIAGFFATGATNARTAFVAGVSAPQILAGIAKVVPAGAKAISAIILGSMVYAQPPVVVPKDSANVLIIMEGKDSLQVKSDKKTYTVGDSTRLVLKAMDTVVVGGFMVEPAAFVPDSGKQTVKLSVKATSSKSNFMRGLFAQQAETPEKQKIIIEIVK